ncbi:MAG TPA: hypothetical protein VMU54_16000 [Planctomycetota bacterium]|nr:hypothetical protein [Planctomycetota bacterium]
MWKVEYRNMTSEEREEIRELLGDCSRVAWQPVGAVAGALISLAASLALTSDPGLLVITVLAGGGLGNLGAWAVTGGRRSALRDALRSDLRNGKVQVFEVVSREVVRLTAPGGSVAGYFAGIGGGHVMFIEPREWEHSRGGADRDFERLFPCTRFSLARAPRSKIDLGFTCDGEAILPLRDIPVASEKTLEDWVEDGDVLWTSLDLVERRLRKLSNQAPTLIAP